MFITCSQETGLIVHELLPGSFTVQIFRLTIVHEPDFSINRLAALRSHARIWFKDEYLFLTDSDHEYYVFQTDP